MMPFLFIVFLAFVILAVWPKKKEMTYQPPKWLSNEPSYMCMGCGEIQDNYFTRCPACNRTAEDLEIKPKKPKDADFPNAKHTCKYCNLKTIDPYYYCPRCGKDENGIQEEANKELYKDVIVADKNWE